MQTLECIKSRRSIRLFSDKEVTNQTIQTIINTGIHAPSSNNCQPWHFIVIKDKSIKDKLANMKTEGNQQHILTSPVCIIVCVDKNLSPSRWIEDGVCATQNMLLAINDLGLGSVYITGYSQEKKQVTRDLQNLLNLPENIIPITLLPIGYPDKKEHIENKELVGIEERMHINSR